MLKYLKHQNIAKLKNRKILALRVTVTLMSVIPVTFGFILIVGKHYLCYSNCIFIKLWLLGNVIFSSTGRNIYFAKSVPS